MIGYWLQYILVRIVWAFFGLVPARKAYDVGYKFGWRVYPLLPRRRTSIAEDNVLQSGVAGSPEEARRIARASTGHFIGHILEALRLQEGIDFSKWAESVEIEETPELRELLLKAKEPIMIVTGHLGSWEVAVPVIAQFRPMIAIARAMNNPYLNRFLQKKHFRGDITVISKERGLTPDIFRQWKRTNAALTIVMDQHAGRRGIRISFFGRPVLAHTSSARIHLRSGAPAIVGAFVRTGPFKYKMISACEAVRYTPTDNHDDDIREVTTQMMAGIESLVRQYPEQYLWLHRRWRKI